MLLPWNKAEPKEQAEIKEGNQVQLSSGIHFYLSHDDSTALMNENTASEAERIEACKFIASLGYTPVENTNGTMGSSSSNGRLGVYVESIRFEKPERSDRGRQGNRSRRSSGGAADDCLSG